MASVTSPARPVAAAVLIDTAKVAGRRTVHFKSFNDVLTDAERLASQSVRPLGNWSLGQIFNHLAQSINMMIDGPPFMVAWPKRVVLRLFLKRRMLTKPMPAGFQLPLRAKQLIPEPTTTAEGLGLLRAAIRRVSHTATRGPHPAFGQLGAGEWDQFQLRHCEMHLSFVVPVDESAS